VRRSRFANAFAALIVLASGAVEAKDDAAAAWMRDGKVELLLLSQQADARKVDATGMKVPLGSLWKLFVYDYLVETQANEPAYVCAQKQTAANDEERYCCTPGESVTRDLALSRSCAPYFSPQRLGISERAWQARHGASPAWLRDIKHLQPETQVPLAELLSVLNTMPAEAKTEARRAMLETSLSGYGKEVWRELGTGIRYKTFSWHREDGRAFGGAAGWLADGTPFWFGADGASRTALNAWAPRLAAALPEPRFQAAASASSNASCVDVDFFTRYPISEVWQGKASVQTQPGDLKGSYRVHFANGNWLSFASRGELALNAGEMPTISGRFAVNDYVARVIDREGSAQSVQAARALAIAARSYLVQNAHFEGGCWHIADSSATQRVSPNPPSKAALAAAWFTDDLVLKGVPVRYHHDAPGKNRMAWSNATARAEQGWDFERILAEAFPQATLAGLGGREECERLDAAESWLSDASRSWQRRLQREPGYEALDGMPKICMLADGNPYSDQRRYRIYVRGWRSLDERITLAHEYLHLVFRFHPHGADEDYIERLARRLIEG
jgi:uncharacterized protein YfaQ (DUF2300 family)